MTALPAGWTRKALGEATSVNPRSFTKPPADDDLVSFVPMAAVEAGSGRLDASQARPWKEIKKGYTPFQDGDVLFAKITPCMENGKAALATGLTGGRAAGSTEFHVVRSTGATEPKFVLHFLLQESFRRAARANMKGTAGQLRVPAGFMESAEIPLPPLPEQRRIVGEIEKQFTRLEAGVAALRRVQANLHRYRAAVLKAACEGRLVPTEAETRKQFETGAQLIAHIRQDKANRIRQGELRKSRKIDPSLLSEPNEPVPDGWAWGRVEDFGVPEDNAIVDGPFGSNLKLTDYVPDGPYPVITITNINEGFDFASLRKISEDKFAELKRSAVRAGDILVAKIGSSYGKTGIYPSHMPVGIIPANLLKITASTALNWKYLFHHLQSLPFRKRLDEIVQYTAQPAFNVSKFKLLPVPVPPLAEQERIVAEVERRLSVVEELSALVTANLQRATRLRQSILQRAFEGKLVTQPSTD